MADVELRRLSDGEETLDAVLGRLSECCLPSPKVWNGRKLFEKLDSLTAYTVFVDLYEKHADSSGMPETQETMRSLGVEVAGDDVHLNDDAPLAWIRQAFSHRCSADAG